MELFYDIFKGLLSYFHVLLQITTEHIFSYHVLFFHILFESWKYPSALQTSRILMTCKAIRIKILKEKRIFWTV